MYTIKKYHESELDKLLTIFETSVININPEIYPLEQLKAWAGRAHDKSLWNERLNENYTMVAYEQDSPIGFGTLTSLGCIDFLYVNHEHQNQGAGSLLLKDLMQRGLERKLFPLYAYVSKAALHTFEKHGFKKIRINESQIEGEVIQNFYMVACNYQV